MSRRVVILGLGSRGDTQPCVALGRELRARGHDVVLVASHRYHDLVTGAGLGFCPLDIDPLELLSTARTSMRGLSARIGPMVRRLLVQISDACEGADLVLSPTLGVLGYHVAQRLGVPCVLMHFQPNWPTRAFGHPMIAGGRSLGGVGNRMGYAAVELGTWQLVRPMINRWRRDQLGLAPMSLRGPVRGRLPVLVGYSSVVVPPPADWPRDVHPTGFWFLDRDPSWRPTPALADFLAAGDPPVCIGFGSMAAAVDQVRTLRIVRSTMDRLGGRAVLLGLEGGSDDRVHVEPDVPHDWLFPRAAAVVHHGGAGTTAAALRAGVPSVVCPLFSDQPFWAGRVAELGAGPAPLPMKRLAVGTLTAALHEALHSQPMRSAAARIGRVIRAERGTELAADRLTRWLS